MRRLATEVGCGVMSLYHQVPSKSALLDGVAEAVLADVEVPSAPGAAWPDQVRAQARAFRQRTRTHPRCTMVALSRPPSSAAMVRPVERALATLREAGYGGQDAVRILRALTAYLAGSLLRESGVAPGLADGDDDGDQRRPRLSAAEFPHMTELAAELADTDPDADFQFGLDMLMRAVAQPGR
jgi:AcrR family transcriptional regulator